MTLYSEVDTEEYFDSIALALIKKRGSAKFPTDEDLKTALRDKDLYNIQSKNRNYMFELLENFNNREYVDTSNENITIEHIFPQNPNDDWNKDITPDDYFQFKEKYANTIANLTLSGNNGALSNKSFQEKKSMNRQGAEQGYNFSRLWLNDYLKTIDKWDISNYNKRFDLIYNRFLKIWEYPDIEIPNIDNTSEANIFNADSPTNKKLEYFIFENDKIEESAVASLYTHVIHALFERNSQLLIDNQDVLKITRNENDFRSPGEISNGYFVEYNIDSKSKFYIIKNLLRLYKMEDELIIKYEDAEHNDNQNRFSVRRAFWKQLLPQISNTELFSNVNPTKDNWLNAGAGISGLRYSFVVTSKFVRVELGISSSNKEKNKKYFKKLSSQKDNIENIFGKPLEWEELAEHKMSRIKYELTGVNLFDKADWDRMSGFLIEYLPKFESALQPAIKKLK